MGQCFLQMGQFLLNDAYINTGQNGAIVLLKLPKISAYGMGQLSKSPAKCVRVGRPAVMGLLERVAI